MHNLIGRQFGRLKVIERGENDKWRRTQWLCLCKCGNQRVYTSAILLRAHVRSCGCHRNELIAWHTKARAMRESGAKTRDIAAALGKKRSAVAQALSAYCGVKVKCPIDHQKVARTWTVDRKSEFAALWLAGLPTMQIASRFNLAYEANVSALATKFKLPPRREYLFVWTPELDNELRALWRKRRHRKGPRKQFMVKEIAEHFNTTREHIYIAARRLKLPRRLNSWVKWTRKQDRLLRELWPNYDISCDQIALKLGHSKPGILNRRSLLELQPRRSHDNQRISLHAWEAMSKEERQRSPEWRQPTMRRSLTKLARGRPPSPTMASAGKPV